MPAEILNRIATALPGIENSATKTKIPSHKNPISIATELKRWKFALALPILNTEDLPLNARDCPQCQLPYNAEFCVSGPKLGHEVPAVLPCGCVIGFHCIRQWLSPHECGYTSCPTCGEGFPDMDEVCENDDVDLQASTDFSWLNISESCDNGGTTGSKEDVASQHDPYEEQWHFPSIDEVLMADLATMPPFKDLTAPESPEIFVTNPDGEPVSDWETENSKPISNADTALSFIKGIATAAMNAADLVTKHVGF